MTTTVNAAQGINPAQGMTLQQLTQHANQAFTQQYAQLTNNIAYGQLQQQIYQQARPLHMWMWNGVSMTIEDFAEHAYGDTPERTHFILKYKETT